MVKNSVSKRKIKIVTLGTKKVRVPKWLISDWRSHRRLGGNNTLVDFVRLWDNIKWKKKQGRL